MRCVVGTGGRLAEQWRINARLCTEAGMETTSTGLVDQADQGGESANRVTDPCDDQAIRSMQFDQAERVGLVAGFADHDASILAGRTAAVAMMQLRAEALWLCTAPMDMRAGVDKLSLHVQQALGRAPCDGTAYVFTNQRRSRLKLCKRATLPLPA